MKVLMTADTIGGVWTHALELASALRARGVRTVLAALGREPTAAQAAEAERIPDLRLEVGAFRLPWMEEPWDDVARAGPWLGQLADGYGVDLVHLSEPVFATRGWPVPVIAVGHSCVLSWFEAVRGVPAPPAWDRYRDAMRAGLHAADVVVAPSAAMLGALRRHYGIRGGRLVRNGRDASVFRPGNKAPVILTAGRLWDPAKNIGLLTAIADGLPWPVHAAGEPCGPDGHAADTGTVEHLGALTSPALAEAMARAAIYVLPARYEPFGQSVLEAALSGCALVLGDIPSLRELWEGAALFVSPDDPAGLSAVLAELTSRPDLRRRLGAEARTRALGLTPGRMANGYRKLYLAALRPACAS